MYAVGQGAIAVECREDDFETLSFLSILHHESTVYRVVAERALLKVLEGGCSAPVAVSTGKETGISSSHRMSAYERQAEAFEDSFLSSLQISTTIWC